MKWLEKMTGQMFFWLSWPLSYVYLRNSYRTMVVVCGGDSIVLVQTWHGNGLWMLPGGGIEKGESAEQAAAREVYEEISIRFNKTALTKIGTFEHKRRGQQFGFDAFSVKLLTTEPLHGRWPEIIAARWIPINELGKIKLEPSVAKVLDAWQQTG